MKIYSLKKISRDFFNMFYRLENPTKLILILVFFTIFSHIFLLGLSEITDGKIFAYGQNFLQQKELYQLRLDGGYFEHFQYLLLLWCSILSFFIFFKHSKKSLEIALMYLFLYFSNCLGLHDRFRVKIFEPILNFFDYYELGFFRLKEISDLIYWSIFGLIFLFFAAKKAFDPEKKIRSFYRTNLKLLLILSFFSIIVDFLNSNFSRIYTLFLESETFNQYFTLINKFINLVEEIGEILLISLIFIFLFEITYKKRLCSNKK